MKYVKYGVGGLVVLIVMVVAGLYYLGAFLPVEFTKQEMGPYKYVYEEYVGDYSKVGPVMTKVYNDLTADGIEATRGIGIYFDDPKTVAKEKLRSEVGSIIEEKDYAKLEALGDKYKIKVLPKDYYLIAEFPFKNQLSIIVGVIKVYPVLAEYLQKNGYAMSEAIEIYEMSVQKITYAMKAK